MKNHTDMLIFHTAICAGASQIATDGRRELDVLVATPSLRSGMEIIMLKPGITGHQEMTVDTDNTARAMESGELDVFATPAMIALAEKTAWMSVSNELADGEGTVGTLVDIAHVAATPVGKTIRCESELTEVDGRRLIFEIEVFDEAGKIGEGRHERFVVNNDRFTEKANNR